LELSSQFRDITPSIFIFLAVLNLSVDFRSKHLLSTGKNYEKAQLPAFSKTKFFLGPQVTPQDFEKLPRTCPRTMEMR
jgi:hypothetical protein